MIEKEETILRKFLSNYQVIVLMQNDILHLVAMAMRAYKNEDTLVKKLTLTDVVGQSEQLVCDNKCEWTRYPKNGIWYDGCVKCGKEVAN